MGVKISAYEPATYWEPASCERVAYSDVSGEELNEDDIWYTDEWGICSREEMVEIFCENFVWYTIENEEEYEKAKQCLIDDDVADPEDFNDHPDILKLIDDFDHKPCKYMLKKWLNTSDLDCYLPEDYQQVDIDDLEINDD